MPYLPYKEPSIITVLSLSSFLILLNVIRYVLDKLLYCGLIGEILIGVIWGFPVGGTAWLTKGTQEAIQAFGYLGLIGLVFDGGLSTNLVQLRKTILLSVSIASVGLLTPVALSFLLILLPFQSATGHAYPSPLAAFSAGASLCSTSLGTTFAILSSADIQKTRVGVILVGAAMLDDLVGLVMVNIVTSLADGPPTPWPIARPIAASAGLLIVTLCTIPYIIKPALALVLKLSTITVETNADSEISTTTRQRVAQIAVLLHQVPHIPFVISMAVLLVFITIASYIDASVLFAAFLAGGVLNYAWSADENQTAASIIMTTRDRYYRPLLDFTLVPFFFASIGFAIPISSMFTSSIVWRGLLYALMMTVAKASTGFVLYCDYYVSILRGKRNLLATRSPEYVDSVHSPPHYQAVLVAFAMVARGEIGFLIASLSQSSGMLALERNGDALENSSRDEVFLVVIWAVMLCTIIGPIMVGIIVRSYARASHPS